MTAPRPTKDEPSAGYTVGHFGNGVLGWWENHAGANFPTPAFSRPATAEEAALMSKCIWATATYADRDRLREMPLTRMLAAEGVSRK
ncbi:MAG: hypothetical protein JWO51_3544 [Rhodospirillales bacterium]|nr:hypothetical protein [Rhodospirillales bacterium]